MKQKLDLTDIIQRSLSDKEDVRPLVKFLGMDESVLDYADGASLEAATTISNHLRRMGSNDIATFLRSGDGVAYDEIVFDVGKKLKAKVKKSNSVEANEELILLKIFEDALQRLTEDEKRSLLKSMGVTEKDIPYGAIGAAAIQNLLRLGGFSVYRITVIVANMMSRSLLGSGLSFATNAALTRTVGVVLGPAGWIATGLWLAFDLAGPAYRKTVPAIIHIALLRTILVNRITVGVVGDGSAGKDALMHAVFGIDSKIDPVAGSTDTALRYPLNAGGSATIINYPGFNDFRPAVDAHTNDYLHHTDVFVMVVDINRGISGTDIKILEKVEAFQKPILICLNKVDLLRSEEDEMKLEKTAQSRLSGYELIKTAFDPDPRLGQKARGVRKTYDWIRGQIQDAGKNVDANNFPEPPKD